MYQQFSLFELAEYEPDFTPDCWETPDDIAQRIIASIKPSDRKSHATSYEKWGKEFTQS